MPAVKTYTRVNFQNYPSTSTPLNATNLNKLDKGIDDLDDEVVAVKNTIENMSFDANAISYDNTQSGLQATDVQGAVDEINDNLAQTPITTPEGETLSTIDDKLNYLLANKIAINDLLALSVKGGASSISDSYTSDFNGQILIFISCFGYNTIGSFTTTIEKNNTTQNSIADTGIVTSNGRNQSFIYLIDVNVGDIVTVNVTNNNASGYKEGMISGIYKLQ